VQHISDLHSKFTLRPLRLGEVKKKKIEDKRKPQDENIMVCPIP